MRSRQQRGLPILHSESRLAAILCFRQWCALKKFRLTVARRRRFFTVFPRAESLMIVYGAVKIPHAPLRTRNSLVAAAQNRARTPALTHLYCGGCFEHFFHHILLIPT